MKSESVYTVLLDYLNQREKGHLDAANLKKRLAQIGKTEAEIHDVLIEFDDEWDRELLHRNEVKYARSILIGGLFLAVCVGFICLLTAMNIGPFTRVPIIWYGGVAGGLMLAIKGWNGERKKKLREQRLRLKYENW